eukprot:CAMPEP_0170591612 /NCGR_PEP_ID=MMETSP0224-20130122/12493_1 /TAXON_ID=285029 /ORGANISM="Togula jolla, Strain CCCM 725" /LENGTH=416 /DNA_ID=CAMNT_0010915481 /DNA_START=88 /DNA_END=1338 /DNA_ORIENTATION=+
MLCRSLVFFVVAPLAAAAVTATSSQSRLEREVSLSQQKLLSSDVMPPEVLPDGNASDALAMPLWDSMQPVVEGLLSMKLVASDVFIDKPFIATTSSLLNAAPQSEWIVLLSTCFVVLCFDILVLQKFQTSRMMNFRILAFWFFVAAAYNAYYWVRYGQEEGLDWCTGYLLEWLLSADNLFVFHLVFRSYNTPEPLMHKALFVGIAGAILFKMIFFLTLGSLMHAMVWIRFVFGGILIYSGIMAVLEDEEEEEDMSKLHSVVAVRSMLGSRLTDSYDTEGQRLFISIDGRLHATLLVLVILVLEVTDVLFAVDSVSAKVAQIDNQYTAYSSSVLAVFGLRAMFFVLHDLVDCFELLKVGLCIILVFIGMQLMLAQWLHLASSTVCIVIVSVMLACIVGSLGSKKKQLEVSLEDKLEA